MLVQRIAAVASVRASDTVLTKAGSEPGIQESDMIRFAVALL